MPEESDQERMKYLEAHVQRVIRAIMDAMQTSSCS